MEVVGRSEEASSDGCDGLATRGKAQAEGVLENLAVRRMLGGLVVAGLFKESQHLGGNTQADLELSTEAAGALVHKGGSQRLQHAGNACACRACR